MMKSYITSIVIASVFCTAMCVLLPVRTANGKITRLLCGIFLTITVVTPLTKLSFSGVNDYISSLSESADSFIADGSAAAHVEIQSIIKRESQAYILDKASQLGLQIAVEVDLDENNHSIPSGVTITGSFSPYAKEILSTYIANTLGIAREKQVWISKG